MTKIKALSAAAGIAIAWNSGAFAQNGYRSGMLGVDTNLRPNPTYMRPSPSGPAMPAPAPRSASPAMPAPAPRVDLRPLPPRPLIERPMPAPAPASPPPRVNVQASPGENPSQGNLHVTVPVSPNTSVTGTATGTLNLPPNQGTPTLDAGKVDITHSTP
jgi:hypothetical protein